MGSSVDEGSRVNAFALVGYIPGPLGQFLDGLRRELVPDCTAHSHVTILPPRMLQSPPDEGWREAAECMHLSLPVDVELRGVEIFPMSQAIYLAIGGGFLELEHLHARLNSGRLRSAEPFTYHPHVTLAQDLPADRVAEVAALARRRWAETDVTKHFLMERLTFVQNSVEPASGCSTWVDLTRCDLGSRCDLWKWSDDGSLSRTSPVGPLPAPGASRDGGEAGSR